MDASGNLPSDAGSSHTVLSDCDMGGMGVGGGKEVQKGGYVCILMIDSW